MIFKFTLFALLFAYSFTFAQVGVGTTSPASSSILDISSTDKGLLIPRVDLGDLYSAHPVQNPKKSLMVWNTDLANGGAKEGFYFWNGELWVRLMAEKARIFADKLTSSDVVINANSPITFDTLNFSEGVVSQANNFSIQKSGFYRLSFNLSIEKQGQGGNSAGIYSFYISTTQNPSGRLDGTLIRTEIPNQFSISNVSLSKIIYLEEDDSIYLMSQRNTKILSDTSFSIEYIR
jgi:hypothetical protein